MWFTNTTLRSFEKYFIYTACVLGWFILLLSNTSSCDIILDETFRIEDSFDDQACKLEHVNLSFVPTIEIECIFTCSIHLASPGVFYNHDNSTCMCCSKDYPISDELPTDNGTRYYTNINKEGRRDCDDLGERGYTLSGIYEIFPNGQGCVNVVCDFDDSDGPWTVIQRRIDDTVDFYVNYTEYQDGFGDLRGNFWLGLDAISSITLQSDKNYSLKVIVDPRDQHEHFAKYTHFHVMNASENYTLYVSGYTGNAGDAMTYHSGAQFSTADKDLDTYYGGNCARRYGGGWWFKDCGESNLNSLYGWEKMGITWKPIDDVIEFTEMKLKENK